MLQTISSFRELTLSPAVARALEEMKYISPTPIQAQAIPAALSGRDLIGCAQTGTGKTAAFCLPIIDRLERDPNARALILAPTRELAAQILKVVEQLTTHRREFRGILLIGGLAMSPQVQGLRRNPAIIVATPGRLVDHLRQGTLKLSATKVLVLDEADRMLDMGFAAQLNEILRHLPRERQTMLFSATLPPDILKLASKYLKDPVRITAGPVSTPVSQIAQAIIHTDNARKNDVLLDQLNARQGSVLIFTRTKRRTDKLASYLEEYGHKVGRIHGNRSQGQRNSALESFRRGTTRILVATDVASRGLDIPHIAHVINFDLPQCAEDYVHRIGRTARAGAKGESLSILTPEDRSSWKDISRLLGKTELTTLMVATPKPLPGKPAHHPLMNNSLNNPLNKPTGKPAPYRANIKAPLNPPSKSAPLYASQHRPVLSKRY